MAVAQMGQHFPILNMPLTMLNVHNERQHTIA